MVPKRLDDALHQGTTTETCAMLSASSSPQHLLRDWKQETTRRSWLDQWRSQDIGRGGAHVR